MRAADLMTDKAHRNRRPSAGEIAATSQRERHAREQQLLRVGLHRERLRAIGVALAKFAVLRRRPRHAAEQSMRAGL